MSFHQKILVSFVEGDSRFIVHSGLEEDGVTMGGSKAGLGAVKQFGTYAASANLWEDVNGDDVSGAALARFGDNETDRVVMFRGLGNYGEAIAALDISFELDFGVGNV